MIVCIAEKPSVAQEIANVLGAKNRHDGYIEGNGYQVTWTFGHLCTLKEPQDYTDSWKNWSLGSLPMIPPRFGIKLIEDKGIEKQFKIIENLMQHATEIVNCGDAGQEGELIQRWVMQKAGATCPVKRLWISSLTEDSIREGFGSLKDQSSYQSLYEAGLCRAIGDWLLGMNATRLYTLKYRNTNDRGVLSIGRVQTPTLALVVRRQDEIDNFVPTQYWEIKTAYRDTLFSLEQDRLTDKDKAQAIIDTITGKEFQVTGVTQKEGKEFPPKLFDLTSLQVECNKKYGYSAEDTLQTIQSLYEKKVTTYPRVDTTYLSTDIYPKVPGILEGLKPYSSMTAPVLEKKIPNTKRVFDNSKVTDHHAIIPTGVNPQDKGLNEREKRVFDMVARRFISVFYPECVFSTTTVTGKVEKYKFKVTGKEILKPGWRVIYEKDEKPAPESETDNAENSVLPNFVEGESGEHVPSLAEKWTTPPKPYTEATLLRAMETAGKTVENDELREALKENGIGRPSTRAAIIETLYKRKYMVKNKKTITPTPMGRQLIGIIHQDLLKSAELTGIWEKKLRQIEKGEYNSQSFVGELKDMVVGLVNQVLADNTVHSLQ
ncbi:MAG: DNA topoisomerase 3 [Bacteroidaceae bacterium]|nr:DNA topoisomerase 3 [Bacteroidaceae bacterium]